MDSEIIFLVQFGQIAPDLKLSESVLAINAIELTVIP